jgi:small subunit ribosomal protein S21
MRLAEVRLQEGESLENALRRFKRKVQQEEIIKEVKRHSFYLKPGEKKRVKEALARKRARKKSRKESQRVGLSCNLGPLPSSGLQFRRAGFSPGQSFYSWGAWALRLYRVQSKVDRPTRDCQDHQARSCAYQFHQRIYLVHFGDQLALFRCP